MPELPEVETVVSGLMNTIVGHSILDAYCSNKSFRGQALNLKTQRLIGSQIQQCWRRGKYILIDLSHNYTLIIHLGMSGKILISPLTQPHKHDHLLLYLSNNTLFRFNDSRRFGIIKLCSSHTLASEPLLANLGLEPLSAEFSVEALAKLCQESKAAIKLVLMNHTLVVGIGNIYANEALFEAAIQPMRPANTLSLTQIHKLHMSIIDVLQSAIASGGSTLRDYVRSDGDSGYFQHHFKVYGRHNAPCLTCATPLTKTTLGQRSTFYCTSCQV